MDAEAFNTVSDTLVPARAEAALLHGLEATAGCSRWIDGGTLLGFERDGHFIAHDTDVDIAVCLTTDEALELRLPSQDLIRTIRWNHLPMQHAYLAHDTIVDLYFYYSDIEPGLLVNVNTEGLLRIPATLVLPIDEEFTWNGHLLPVPNLRREYLAWSYGATWTTPAVAKSDWSQEHAHLDPNHLVSEWQLPVRHERIATLVGAADDQRHHALASRDLALTERDQARLERDAAVARRDVAVAQRDEAVVQRDEAVAQHDEAVVQRDEAQAKRDRAVHDATRAKQDLGAIHRSRVWRLASRYYSVRRIVSRPFRRTNG